MELWQIVGSTLLVIPSLVLMLLVLMLLALMSITDLLFPVDKTTDQRHWRFAKHVKKSSINDDIHTVPYFVISYKNNDTAPDKIAQMADHYGISEQALIKRFISRGLNEHFPPQRPISDYGNLDDLLTRGGYKK
jgi:hypothetical protein